VAWDEGGRRRARLPDNWHQLRDEVLRRDNWQCRIRGPRCVVLATDVDHKDRGDDHAPSNLQAACRPCHAAKSSGEGNAAWADIRRQTRHPGERHPGMR
jgi:5-methylcytosine-specific restriction protein A